MDDKKTLTLGSLFSGSGGFELAGMLAGIKPVWNSDVEPFPILVTHRRLPQVKHYGDVNKLKGNELEPVDIITFGSPCVDLSVAGKREGIHAPRSGLFFQAIRIIREMREATNGKYPRYAVYENVTGVFSSNKGEDFRCALEAIIGIKEKDVSLPAPEKGKWAKADVLLGDGWSVAYRTFDSKYWTVAQRRARVYLVADFAGESAGEILFKSDGLSGYSAESFSAWKGITQCSETSVGTPGGTGGTIGHYCVNPQASSGLTITEEQTGTLVAQDHGNHPAVLQSAGFCTEHSAQSRGIGYEEEQSPTLRAGVVPAAISLENHPADGRIKISENGIVQTLTERMGTGGGSVPLVAETEDLGSKEKENSFLSYGIAKEAFHGGKKAAFNFAVDEELSPTLQTKAPHAVAKTEIMAFGVCSKSSHSMMSDNPHSGFYEAETSRTLDCNGGNPTANQGGIAILEAYDGETAVVNFDEVNRANRANEVDKVDKPDNESNKTSVETYDVRFTSEGTRNSRGHCYETEISRCLDTGGEKPDSNHGGICVIAMEPGAASRVGGHVYTDGKSGTLRANAGDNQQAVVAFTQNQRAEVRDLKDRAGALQAQPGMKQRTYVLQGNMIGRDDRNGPQGSGVNEDVCFTLNCTDKHAVTVPETKGNEEYEDDATYCATTGSFMSVEKEMSHTLMARDYKDPQILNERTESEPVYIVRRLTPTECARLQAFPDWWCHNLAITEPSDEEIAFWKCVWNEWNSMNGKRPKTENQIRKWLANPYSDAAEYKLWGNCITVTVAWFVLAGIAWSASKQKTQTCAEC